MRKTGIGSDYGYVAADILKEACSIVTEDLSRCNTLVFPMKNKFEDTYGYQRLLKQTEAWLETGVIPETNDVWWLAGLEGKVPGITNIVISGVYDIICPVPFITFLPNGRSLWKQQKERCIHRTEGAILKLGSHLRGIEASRSDK